MGEVYALPVRGNPEDAPELETVASVSSLPDKPVMRIDSSPEVAYTFPLEPKHANFAQRLLYGLGKPVLMMPYTLRRSTRKDEFLLAQVNKDIENGPAYKVRRAGAGVVAFALASALTVGAAIGSKPDSHTAPVSVTPNPAPVECVFSPETFNFVPKAGQGWMDAIRQTEGAMDDASCYAQELDHLRETYGEQPQFNLNLTPYPEGYPIPEEVHRATTTTTEAN